MWINLRNTSNKDSCVKDNTYKVMPFKWQKTTRELHRLLLDPGFCSNKHTNPHTSTKQKWDRIGTSLLVWWQAIRLTMQGTLLRPLIWDDPTGLEATEPMHHPYPDCALQPTSCNYGDHLPQLLKPVRPRVHALQRETTAMRSLHTPIRAVRTCHN